MHLLLLRVMTNISSFSFFLLATFLFILMSRSSIVFSLFAFVEFFISAACGTKVRECGTPTDSACMQMCSYTCMFIIPPFQSAVIYSVVLFMKSSIDFKILSLHVRGIRSFEKRKAISYWLTKKKSDIIFLQETYGTPGVENHWKSQWRGDVFFSHGSENSRKEFI